jgi:hypothetical protein
LRHRQSAETFRKEEFMSEERFDQEEAKDETEDVEAHQKTVMANEEPGTEEESDDVEGHIKRAQHKSE